MATRCAALELGPAGVRCNSINPGPVETGFHRYFFKLNCYIVNNFNLFNLDLWDLMKTSLNNMQLFLRKTLC